MNWLDLKPINSEDTIISINKIQSINLVGNRITINLIDHQEEIVLLNCIEAKKQYEKIRRYLENYGPIPKDVCW